MFNCLCFLPSTDCNSSTKMSSSVSINVIPPSSATLPICVTAPQHAAAKPMTTHKQSSTHMSHTKHGPISAVQVIHGSAPVSQATQMSASHQLLPAVMTSQINQEGFEHQSGRVIRHSETRTVTSTTTNYISPNSQMTPLPTHQPPMIHTHSAHTHSQLGGIAYQQLRSPSQLLPRETTQHCPLPQLAQQTHMDFHETERPVTMSQTEQLTSISDEQLTTLAGVASALFGDGLNSS